MVRPVSPYAAFRDRQRVSAPTKTHYEAYWSRYRGRLTACGKVVRDDTLLTRDVEALTCLVCRAVKDVGR